jgi:hypothetical protein
MPRHLLVGAPLEIAQHQGRAVAFGKPLDLRVEDQPQLVAGLDAALRCRHRRTLFMPPSAGGGRASARRGPEGHLMEPGTERVAHPETRGFLDQDQKSGLEGILRVVRVGQHAPADPQDHRSVPLEQDRERQRGSLAPAGRKPFQELPVRPFPDRSQVEERAKLPDDRPVLSDRHRRDSPPAACSR